MGFVKLHDAILNSSILEEDVIVRWVWICLLVSCDRNGNIYGTTEALARRANVTAQQFKKALAVLVREDPGSTSPDYGGRRVVVVDQNLLFCVNYQHYRAMKDPEEVREQARIRKQRQREREKLAALTPWAKDNPEAAAAHSKLNAAIESGDMVRPQKCEGCGKLGQVDGHHEDYAYPLDVLWLCRKCHKGKHVTPPSRPVTNSHDKAEAEAEAEADSKSSSSKKPSSSRKDDDDLIKFVLGFWKDEDLRPRVRSIGRLRRQSILARQREYGEFGRANIEIALENRANSRFLCFEIFGGKGAPIDWMFGPKNFPKVIDGNYNDDPGAKKPAPEDEGGEWVYDTYRREDMNNHGNHSRWDEYTTAAVGYVPLTAPTFEEWLEEQKGE